MKRRSIYIVPPNPRGWHSRNRKHEPSKPSQPEPYDPRPRDNRTLWEMLCGVKIGESKYDKRRRAGYTGPSSYIPKGRV